jgi:hypothetical protein
MLQRFGTESRPLQSLCPAQAVTFRLCASRVLSEEMIVAPVRFRAVLRRSKMRHKPHAEGGKTDFEGRFKAPNRIARRKGDRESSSISLELTIGKARRDGADRARQLVSLIISLRSWARVDQVKKMEKELRTFRDTSRRRRHASSRPRRGAPRALPDHRRCSTINHPIPLIPASNSARRTVNHGSFQDRPFSIELRVLILPSPSDLTFHEN